MTKNETKKMKKKGSCEMKEIFEGYSVYSIHRTALCLYMFVETLHRNLNKMFSNRPYFHPKIITYRKKSLFTYYVPRM